MAKRMSMNNVNIRSFKESLREYINYCRLKNLSEHTIDFYEETIGVFSKYYSNDEDFKLKEIILSVVESYILYLKSTQSNTISINTRLRGLRAFLYWCMTRGYVEDFKITLLKQIEVIKDTFTDEEIKLLIHKPDIKICTFVAYRDWVIVNFLLGTGVRVSTLVAIKLKDIDLNASVFKTRHNKNNREQILPIGRALNRVLTEYLIYRKATGDDELLFCNQYGMTLTTGACESAVERYGKRRGVMKSNCHKFRHTFAKNWILSGGDAFRLQKILGHSSMDVVRKYVNIYGSELQKDFDRFNLLDRFTLDKQSIQMVKANTSMP
jgi:integrase/recombinase XerD